MFSIALGFIPAIKVLSDADVKKLRSPGKDRSEAIISPIPYHLYKLVIQTVYFVLVPNKELLLLLLLISPDTSVVSIEQKAFNQQHISPRGRGWWRSSSRRSRRRRSRTGSSPGWRRWPRTRAPRWPRLASACPRRRPARPRSPRRPRQSSSGCICGAQEK